MRDEKDITAAEILALKLDDDNDSGMRTIRQYLIKLLELVWIEAEGFSGKRPFGNSSWQYDLLVPLIREGLVWGELDEYGYVNEIDHRAADRLILKAIRSLYAVS